MRSQQICPLWLGQRLQVGQITAKFSHHHSRMDDLIRLRDSLDDARASRGSGLNSVCRGTRLRGLPQ
jgi:hypothetical protein